MKKWVGLNDNKWWKNDYFGRRKRKTVNCRMISNGFLYSKKNIFSTTKRGEENKDENDLFLYLTSLLFSFLVEEEDRIRRWTCVSSCFFSWMMSFIFISFNLKRMYWLSRKEEEKIDGHRHLRYLTCMSSSSWKESFLLHCRLSLSRLEEIPVQCFVMCVSLTVRQKGKKTSISYLDRREGNPSMNRFSGMKKMKLLRVWILPDMRRGLEKTPDCGSLLKSPGWDHQSLDQDRIRLQAFQDKRTRQDDDEMSLKTTTESLRKKKKTKRSVATTFVSNGRHWGHNDWKTRRKTRRAEWWSFDNNRVSGENGWLAEMKGCYLCTLEQEETSFRLENTLIPSLMLMHCQRQENLYPRRIHPNTKSALCHEVCILLLTLRGEGPWSPREDILQYITKSNQNLHESYSVTVVAYTTTTTSNHTELHTKWDDESLQVQLMKRNKDEYNNCSEDRQRTMQLFMLSCRDFSVTQEKE